MTHLSLVWVNVSLREKLEQSGVEEAEELLLPSLSQTVTGTMQDLVKQNVKN